MRQIKQALTLALLVSTLGGAQLAAQELNDLEMAHVAVTANSIDAAYAHLALALSSDPDVRAFAETMIRDHNAVTAQVAKLAAELGVEAQDNHMSHAMLVQAEEVKKELASLRGADFDRRYAENEAEYHAAVNGVVRDVFIPNIQNERVKEAFQAALEIFLVHQQHAESLSRAQR